MSDCKQEIPKEKNEGQETKSGIGLKWFIYAIEILAISAIIYFLTNKKDIHEYPVIKSICANKFDYNLLDDAPIVVLGKS